MSQGVDQIYQEIKQTETMRDVYSAATIQHKLKKFDECDSINKRETIIFPQPVLYN